MLWSVLCTPILAIAAYSAVIVPLPLSSPVFINLNLDPVVTIGTRTIDFTPNLGQEFIHFLPAFATDLSGTYGFPAFRETVGLRARDGLASLSGAFPPSPDPLFANVLPGFIPGTTDLILFDLIIAGYGTPFSFTMTDLDGDIANPMFASPIPEPSTALLLLVSLIGIGTAFRAKLKKA